MISEFYKKVRHKNWYLERPVFKDLRVHSASINSSHFKIFKHATPDFEIDSAEFMKLEIFAVHR